MNEPEAPQPHRLHRSESGHSEQEEEAAVKALLQYNPDAVNPRVFNTNLEFSRWHSVPLRTRKK
jgi:hypothetical protein